MTLRTIRTHPSAVREPAVPVGSEALTVLGEQDTIDLLAAWLDLLRDAPATTVEQVLTALLETQRRRELDEQLVERLMPASIPTPAHVLQLQRNASLRAAALAEQGTLNAGDLARLRGIETVNEHATPARWLKERRVFAVDGPHERRFPAFQFTADGQPRRSLQPILGALPAALSGWEILLWFSAPNGWLGGARPVDRLEAAPDEVARAAALAGTSIDD
ncbi:MAG: hypothetical protein U0869_10660 [Chloroflexota bacterium]